MAETEINALEMVRRIRDDLHEKTKGMSEDELLQFYRGEAEAVNTEALSQLAKRSVTTAR
ncbi:MAG TPA: hypothetical protein VEW48_08855 [Thermoanaerobaculia bacterium]|nr:hypothetical protein [Thermoanaerobaculia bacterium]